MCLDDNCWEVHRMKKWTSLLLALLLFLGTAQAEYPWLEGLSDTGPSAKELAGPAQAAYPDWQVWETEEYWSGLYNGGPQSEHHCIVYMYRVEADRLLVMSLWTLANPLREGNPIPWEETLYAPIPLTAEAAGRIAAMAPVEVFEKYEGASLSGAALPGSAEFLVEEGETLTQLIAYPDFLVGIVQNVQGQESLRIGHWNGMAYDKVTATDMVRYVSINEIHSWNDGLELYVPGAELWAYCDEDGVWQLSVVTDGGRYFIQEDYICDAEAEYVWWNNDWYTYGQPTFPTQLHGMDFAAVPKSTEDATAQMDATGFACVKADGAALYDAPDGNVLANCHTRLTGRVLAEQDGWVQLQIGSAEEGMTGWFRAEDLAFGNDVNALSCGFPTYDAADPEALEALLGDEYWYELWLIARLPDGDWLAQVDGVMVREIPTEVIGEVGPPCRDAIEWEEEWLGDA